MESDWIISILKDFAEEYDDGLNCKDCRTKLATAIRAEMDNVIPEKRLHHPDAMGQMEDVDFGQVEGWNACRTQIRKALGLEEK